MLPSATDAAPPKPSAARDRLLETASRIFYAEGVHAVGVDRVISEAQVTRATFYRHFPGKELLVEAYLRAADVDIRTRGAAAAEALGTGDPLALVRAFVAGVGDEICLSGFRGCPFINAAAEYPDPDSAVRVVVDEHRAWFHDTLEALLTAGGHADPAHGARVLVQLRDGAMVGGYLGDQETARATLIAAAEGVIGG
ncbi:TetR/AcrR family transcriptional regulator [Patulibacter sp. NPDC049589]|uniref:TetR/AcrR family transcriptional regulator n=1 Tax=Patulibacter sp. NPDC049589 TaxID=3154731 RepID=UPI00342791C2